jgi:hypothetical protein
MLFNVVWSNMKNYTRVMWGDVMRHYRSDVKNLDGMYNVTWGGAMCCDVM